MSEEAERRRAALTTGMGRRLLASVRTHLYFFNSDSSAIQVEAGRPSIGALQGGQQQGHDASNSTPPGRARSQNKRVMCVWLGLALLLLPGGRRVPAAHQKSRLTLLGDLLQPRQDILLLGHGGASSLWWAIQRRGVSNINDAGASASCGAASSAPQKQSRVLFLGSLPGRQPRGEADGHGLRTIIMREGAAWERPPLPLPLGCCHRCCCWLLLVAVGNNGGGSCAPPASSSPARPIGSAAGALGSACPPLPWWEPAPPPAGAPIIEAAAPAPRPPATFLLLTTTGLRRRLAPPAAPAAPAPDWPEPCPSDPGAFRFTAAAGGGAASAAGARGGRCARINIGGHAGRPVPTSGASADSRCRCSRGAVFRAHTLLRKLLGE